MVGMPLAALARSRQRGLTMEPRHLDRLARALATTPSRRDIVRGLVAAGLGLGGLRLQGAVGAKQKRKKNVKKKKKLQKPTFNEFGCLDVGQPCRGNSANCCSSICQGNKPKKGKKDKSTCVAHNTGICTASSDICSTGVNAICNHSNPLCGCVRTTGNAGFCGDFTVGGDKLCRVCSKDTDCQAEFGPGAACLVYGGICTDICPTTGGTACVPPCV
jgi:hypothetical protein